MTAKDLALPAKITQSYQTLEQLSDAKIKLAERIVELITRARARLEIDVARVLALTGETLPMDTLGGIGGHHDITSAGGGISASGGIISGSGRTSAASIFCEGAKLGKSNQPHLPVASVPETSSCVMLVLTAPTERKYVLPYEQSRARNRQCISSYTPTT